MSSVLVAEGEPALLLGLVGEETELLAALEVSGRLAISVLGWDQRPVADGFAGVRPTPGGPFRGHDWHQTEWGPVPASAPTWAGCRLRDLRPAGYARLVEAELERITIGPDAAARSAQDADEALVWQRGRYRKLPH